MGRYWEIYLDAFFGGALLFCSLSISFSLISHIAKEYPYKSGDECPVTFIQSIENHHDSKLQPSTTIRARMIDESFLHRFFLLFRCGPVHSRRTLNAQRYNRNENLQHYFKNMLLHKKGCQSAHLPLWYAHLLYPISSFCTRY